MLPPRGSTVTRTCRAPSRWRGMAALAVPSRRGANSDEGSIRPSRCTHAW